ncbi:MAG: sulfide/dihydroorotate dehydrogenase-like FAD/NAD-binding protein [Candidatus Aminicenantes bacterium]|nr:sulfide/dihydroorotate dehydrogenase-like FAD/NAD-binding protein [Candidatus Aminicenantes bacterium]HHF51930.1 sulfide/dihydroorotate dehydrogenase-like FAD/NAD-binding protein [Candidatus Aminicenantes bacterium]
MIHKIVSKKKLNHDTYKIEIKAAHVAERFRAGQFVIIRIHDKGERIPLTVSSTDSKKGTITLIFQVVGKTTFELSTLNAGDSILNCVGPLGNPTEIKLFGRVICIGGGTGIACIYPIVKALVEAGNKVISILGARTDRMLILESEIKEISSKTYISTDDGSKGHHGFVTDVLKIILKENHTAKTINRILVIGPPQMMKAAAEVTRPYQIKTIASLNTIMIDGTGMCGCCRTYVNGEMKLACIDGPEFDAHKVDFDSVISRLSMFRQKEVLAYKDFKKRMRLK